MSGAWITVIAVGLGTVAIKGLGPVVLGGRPLPQRLTGVIELLARALLAALVAVQAFGAERALVLDARVLGLAAAALALWRRAPVLVVLSVAAATTALVRLIA
jgi:branched-subunit amino acid transport protein